MITLNLILPILCIVASFIILFQLKNIVDAFKSYSWEKTKAYISDFTIEKTNYADSNFFNGKIRFEYEVNNKKYFGNLICFSNSLTSCCPNSSLGKYLKNAYQNKQPIDVFYDPTDPQNAAIKNGIPTDMIFSLVSLVIFIGVGFSSFL